MHFFRSPWRQLGVLAAAGGMVMAVRRLFRRRSPATRRQPIDDEALDRALEDSFPASDPPALSGSDCAALPACGHADRPLDARAAPATR